MSVGLPELYVLPALLFLVVPFQYAIFCLLQKRREPKAKEESRKPEMFPEALVLQQVSALPGQMKEQVGMTFGTSLRRVLRVDPDVILLGEIRDLETIEAASKLALVGCPVLYTEHARDVPSAINRPRYMGTESEQRAVGEAIPKLTRTSSMPSLMYQVLQENKESIEIQKQFLEKSPSSLPANRLIPFPILANTQTLSSTL